jgi:hypothetical protein
MVLLTADNMMLDCFTMCIHINTEAGCNWYLHNINMFSLSKKYSMMFDYGSRLVNFGNNLLDILAVIISLHVFYFCSLVMVNVLQQVPWKKFYHARTPKMMLDLHSDVSYIVDGN